MFTGTPEEDAALKRKTKKIGNEIAALLNQLEKLNRNWTVSIGHGAITYPHLEIRRGPSGWTLDD